MTEDRFEESGPDYGLFYKVSLSKSDCLEMCNKIRKSKDWTEDEEVWRFYKAVDGTIYNITFYPDMCRFSYIEELI